MNTSSSRTKPKMVNAKQQAREHVTINSDGLIEESEDIGPCWEDCILYLLRTGQATLDKSDKKNNE